MTLYDPNYPNHVYFKFWFFLHIYGTGEASLQNRPATSQRPITQCLYTNCNIDADELMLSQDDAPQTHGTSRQISREVGYSQTSVMRIIQGDLRLRCFKRRRAQELTEANCLARLTWSKKLLRNFSSAEVDFVFLSDEKMFTVATPINLHNDRIYAPTAVVQET